MTLSILPKELRREIVDHLADDYDVRKAKIRGLHSLSATCQSLNTLCGHIIFRTYYLDIRNAPTNLLYPKGSANKSWDRNAIRARLALLQTKSAFVREIYITDRYDFRSLWGAPPTVFIPELLDTLRMLGLLTSIHLVTYRFLAGPSTAIDPDLWKWIVGVRPRMLFLDGFFEIPAGEILQPIENLDTLSLHSCTNANKALIYSHKPRHITFTYTSVPCSENEDSFPYKPTDGNLESINIEFEITGRMCALEKAPLFDFSRVPQASIKVTVTDISRCLAKSADIRLILQRIFVEELSGYDVRQISDYAEITRLPRRVETEVSGS